MNIVLVCINNFQDYIIDNINQLNKLNHKNIYIITNQHLNTYFENIKNINLINIEELNDDYNFYNKTKLDKQFRNGFWTLTSLRFFYLYSFIKKYNINNVIHIENDVLIYYNIEILKNNLSNEYIYIPFDTFNRNIASIMYIPNHDILKKILDNYDINKNDMDNFAYIKRKTNLIQNFPIFNEYNSENNEIKFVSTNYDKFNFIFDAAAIGQFIGGVDPRNQSGDTSGFVNETCIIKYNNYTINWKYLDNIKKPFINIDNINIPIFNLHIHCKNLKKFIN